MLSNCKSLLKDDMSPYDIVKIIEEAIASNPYYQATCAAAKDLITVDMGVSNIISFLETLKEKIHKEYINKQMLEDAK